MKCEASVGWVLRDERVRQLVYGRIMPKWDLLLRQSVPHTEIGRGGEEAQNLLGLFVQNSRRGGMGLLGPLRERAVSQGPSPSLLMLFAVPHFHQGCQPQPCPSCSFCTHFPELLHPASALTHGSRPTILCFWAIWAPGVQILSLIFPQLSSDLSEEWALKIIHLTNEMRLSHFSPCLWTNGGRFYFSLLHTWPFLGGPPVRHLF